MFGEGVAEPPSAAQQARGVSSQRRTKKGRTPSSMCEVNDARRADYVVFKTFPLPCYLIHSNRDTRTRKASRFHLV
ncbi:hypothetical protein COI98_09465 [Bacillus cereus]|uniref:Uncharacterized protein n=1 Tax=Bacillus cereus TaxID=1396 RepID=A0A9X6ZZR8_BACCE|nr:hypothetical protein COI98_09465 [Bacillus cereus]